MMNYESGNDPYNRVTAVYWSVSQVTLEGVLDQVRTTLVGLVAEMRAAIPNRPRLHRQTSLTRP